MHVMHRWEFSKKSGEPIEFHIDTDIEAEVIKYRIQSWTCTKLWLFAYKISLSAAQTEKFKITKVSNHNMLEIILQIL